ncbi:transglutaminase domain-containing protein [Aneurinibacillus terranovensis]|uniref:transglutaminase domain-containing protein n=1 Tax=Aneurinibacillus terranovensis TaxID=278991 RepID=UPI000401D907|nr:transglutaminase domain-containing protein [Aneurinibacillus terranovensis]
MMPLYKKSSILLLSTVALFLSSFSTCTNAYAASTVYTPQQLKKELAQHIKNRETTFTITYMGDTSDLEDLIADVTEQALRDDNYTKYNLKSHGFKAMGFDNDMAIEFAYEYRTTKEQEEEVDERVNQILNRIIKKGMNDDEKEKAIHDYIVANTRYDTNYNNYTAYEALTQGKAVCQGYALLAYKMLDKAGIQNQIVEGTAGDQPHTWNLVNLDGKWYNLDCTWDDPVPDEPGRVMYNYYNLTDRQIGKDHFWLQSHPPAITLYKKKKSIYSAGIQAENKITGAAHFQPDTLPATVKTNRIEAASGKQQNIVQAIQTLGSQLWIVLGLLINELKTIFFK